jgi:transposase
LQEARAGRRAVFFVDAAHFVWAPFLGWLWCLSRLFVRSATGRRRYNVLGALNAVTQQCLRVTNEGYINAETVGTLLRTLAGAGFRMPITLVLDNVKYQRCDLVQSLARSLGIELLFLPSYSPNLNLIERLWRFVRKRSLNSTYYESFEQFQAAIDGCLDSLATK